MLGPPLREERTGTTCLPRSPARRIKLWADGCGKLATLATISTTVVRKPSLSHERSIARDQGLAWGLAGVRLRRSSLASISASCRLQRPLHRRQQELACIKPIAKSALGAIFPSMSSGAETREQLACAPVLTATELWLL